MERGEFAHHRVGYLSGALRVSTRPDAETLGPRAHILGVTGALRRAGFQVDSLIIGDRLPLTRRAGLEKAARSRRAAAVAGDVVRIAANPVFAIAAARAIKPPLDFVYERFASFQAMGRAFQRLGVPWVLETNGIFYDEAASERKTLALRSIAKRIEESAYRDCDVLVCVSPRLRELLIEKVRIPEEKILMLPNGVDTSSFRPMQPPAIAGARPFTVGFVGAVVEWQGLDLLIRAQHLLANEGCRFELVIAGEGPALAGLRALADELGNTADVRFLGRVSPQDVPALISTFSLGYSGHRDFGLGGMYHSPLKLYEYQACGVPILAASHPDAKALARNGTLGFLFDSNSTESLAAAIRAAARDPDALAKTGTLARQNIEEAHSWDARVQTLLAHISHQVCRRRERL